MENTKHFNWTVIGKDGRHLVCRCDCGTISKILKFDLLNGKSTMCRDCKYKLRKGTKRPEITKHGLSDSPTQHVWSDMKRRCLDPKRRGYENYGGRGIKVCARWIDGEDGKSGFECFLDDLGPRPSTEYQLDRIDNDGNYTKQNCRWVEKAKQNYNKRNTFHLTVFGETITLEEAEKRFGIKKSVIYSRIKTYKMNPEIAVTKPVRGS